VEAPAFQLTNDARETLDSFKIVDVDLVRRITMASPTKSYDLNPIMTHILDNFTVLGVLAPSITTSVNVKIF